MPRNGIHLFKYIFFDEKGLFSFETKKNEKGLHRNGDSLRIMSNPPCQLRIIVSQEIYPPIFTIIGRGVLK